MKNETRKEQKKDTKKPEVRTRAVEELRLNKFISHNSNYSRREADALIAEGKVKVNNRVITDLATKVKVSDKVEIGKKIIKEDKERMYTVIVYNKPKGELVTKSDPQGRKTIYDGLDSKYKHFNSVNVVNALMHSNLERVYKVKVSGPISPKIEMAMQKGLEIDDATKGAYKKTKIKSMNFAPFLAYDIQTNGEKISKIKVVISEGKNRELRRFFGYFGLDVMDLKRVEYGGVSLNNLPTGKTRFLTKEEYKNLRIFLNEEDDRLS